MPSSSDSDSEPLAALKIANGPKNQKRENLKNLKKISENEKKFEESEKVQKIPVKTRKPQKKTTKCQPKIIV